jgi:hydroxyacylglutathione hydrolase
VVAPEKSKSIPGVDETVHEGDGVVVGNLAAKVIETPGHTLDHVAYWFPKDQLAFVGDTLFSIGCGRVIEGNAEMMWHSLVKLRDLPNETLVYCGHEYTAANIRFALTIDKDNPVLQARAAQVEQLIEEGAPTIPVSIGDEKLANPFLRADVPDLAVDIGMAGRPAAEVFAEIRGRKDRF